MTPSGAPEARCLYNPLRKPWDAEQALHPHVGLLPGAAAPPVDTRLDPQRRVTPNGAPEARCLYNPLRKLWDAEHPLHPHVGLLPGAAAPPVNTPVQPSEEGDPNGAPEARCLYNPLRKLWDAEPLRPPTRGKLRSMRASPHGASLGTNTKLTINIILNFFNQFFMKKINYYLGALALASLSLGACSSDKLAGEEPNGPDTKTERTVYVNIAIHGEGAGSRANHPAAPGTPDGNPDADTAGDFDNGEGTESDVNSVYLVFYDDAKNVVGNIVSLAPDFKDAVAGDGATVEKKMEQVVTLTLLQGQADPSYVMCYINPANPADLQNPLKTVPTVQRAAATVNSANNTLLFPMSNSVYYKDQTATEPEMAVEIPANLVFDTKKEADDALEAGSDQILDIYVERYAAKLTMQGISGIKPYVTATTTNAALGTATEVPVVLTYVVDGWAVNGEAKTTFAVKSFREASTDGMILPNDYSWTESQNEINGTTNVGTWSWNNPNYHRSYWAHSPVYFQAGYPEVFTDYQGKEDQFNQVFLSYDDICGTNGATKVGFAATDHTPHYFKETTVGTPGLTSANPNAAVASVILVGHYTMTIGGTKTEGADGTVTVTGGTPVTGTPTFYTYVNGSNGNPTVYFEAGENAASQVEGGLSMQKRFLWQTTTLYKKVGNDYVRMSANDATDLALMARITEVTRPNNTVLGNVKMADRTKTLQIKHDTEQETVDLTGVYINVNGKPKLIVKGTPADTDKEISLNGANEILWHNVGTCNMYVESAGAFNIPIKHLGYYRKSNAVVIDVAHSKVGDFGMVRNHSYQLNVTEISGLAAGIPDKSHDIIPPADTKDVYMAYRINVLRWAVVPVQGVKL